MFVWKNTIKKIGHHACLRDIMGPSYPTYACTGTSHKHNISLVQCTFLGSWKQEFLK